MASGATIIGKAAIKIVPDTEGFSRTLKRKLKDGKESATIKLDIDEQGFRRELDRAVRQAARAIDKVNVKPKKLFDYSPEANSRLHKVLEDWENREYAVRFDREATKAHMLEAVKSARRNGKEYLEKNPVESKLFIKSEEAFDKLRRRTVEINARVANSAALNALKKQLDNVKVSADKASSSMKKVGDSTKRISSSAKDLLVSSKAFTTITSQVREASKWGREFSRTMRDIGKVTRAAGSAFSGIGRSLSNTFKVANLRDSSGALASLAKGLTGLGTQAKGMANSFSGAMNKMLGKVNLASVAMDSLSFAWNNFYGKVFKAGLNVSGFTLMGDLFKGMSDFAQNIGNMPRKIAPAVLSMETMRSAVIALAGNVLTLGRDVTRILPIVGLLPGAFAVGGAGAMILSRSLKDASTQLAGPIKKFQELGTSVSDGFWSKAKDPLESVAYSLLPEIEKGATKSSLVMGKMAGQLGKAVEKATKGRMHVIFDALDKSVESISGHLEKITKGLFDVVQVGAKMLPGIVKNFGQLADKMGLWLSAIAQSGQLEDWISGAIDRFKSLASIVYSAALMFREFSDAAELSGSLSLRNVADGLARVRDIVQRPEFRSGLVDTFTAANKAMQNFAVQSGPGIAKLFETFPAMFAKVGPAIGDAAGKLVGMTADFLGSSQVLNGYTSLVMGIRDAVFSLGPAFETSKAPMGVFLKTLGQLTSDQGSMVSNVITGINVLLERFSPVAHAAQLAASSLGLAFSELFKHGSILINQNFDLSFERTRSALEKLRDGMGPLVERFKQVQESLITTIGPHMSVFIAQLDRIGAVIVRLVPSIGELMAKFGESKALTLVIVPILGNITASLLVLEGALRLVDGAVKTLSFTWGLVNGAVDGVVSAFTWLGSTVNSSANTISDWSRRFRSALEGMREVANSAMSGVTSSVGSAMSSFSALVRNGIGAAGRAFQSLPGQARSAMSSVGSTIRGAAGGWGGVLVGAGRAIIDGLIRGIRSALGRLRSTLGSVTSMIPRWKGPYEKDKVLLKDAGHAIMDGLIKAISERQKRLKTELQAVTTMFENVVPNAATDIFSGDIKATSTSVYRDARMAVGPATPIYINIQVNAGDITTKKGIESMFSQVLQEIQNQDAASWRVA